MVQDQESMKMNQGLSGLGMLLSPMNRQCIIRNWFYCSPDLYALNKKMQDQEQNRLLDEGETKMMIRDGSLYSMQSVILNQLVFGQEGDDVLKERMLSVQVTVRRVYRKNDPDHGALLRMVWSLRTALLRDCMDRHPGQRYLLEIVLSRLHDPVP